METFTRAVKESVELASISGVLRPNLPKSIKQRLEHTPFTTPYWDWANAVESN